MALRIISTLLLSSVIFLPLPTTVLAADGVWAVEANGTISTEAAGSSLQFRCENGDVSMEIRVPLTPDLGPGVRIEYYADSNRADGFDLPGVTIIADGGTMLFPMAPAGGFARVAREASEFVNVRFSTGDAAVSAKFSAKGSTTGVNALAAACG